MHSWTSEVIITLESKLRSKDDAVRHEIYNDNERAWSQVVHINEISLRNHETLRQIFRRIAKNYESLHDLGDYKFPLDTIATTMVKVLEKYGLNHYRRNLYHAFEDPVYSKYKRTYTKELYEYEYENNNNNNANVTDGHFVVPEESKLALDEVKEAYEVIRKADYRLFTRRQHQEIAELADKNKLFAQEQCEIRGISIDDEKDSLSALDKMNPFREIMHLKKPERREGVLTEEIDKTIEDMKSLREKIAEFGGAIPLDLEHKFAEGWHAFRMFIRPWLDDKWRRDWGGWAEIMQRRADTTKHGVESLSELEGAEIRGYNEKGKPIKAKKGITCEQIDNKVEQAAEAFSYMIKNLPLMYYCVATYRIAKVPYFVDFTNDLSPKLSHSS